MDANEHLEALRTHLEAIWFEVPYALAYALVPTLTKLRDEGVSVPYKFGGHEDLTDCEAAWKASLTTMIDGFQAILETEAEEWPYEPDVEAEQAARRDAGLAEFATHYAQLWD